MLGMPVTGLSASAIAGSGKDHPWDPGDLRRCMEYCEHRGISTDALLERMAGRSLAWDRLLPEWDRLTALLRHEMDTRDDHIAPRTYQEMKVVLSGGDRCTTCDGSGRGEDCAPCKGTGHRNGGRCRAEGCIRGARACPTCRGNGYVNGWKEER